MNATPSPTLGFPVARAFPTMTPRCGSPPMEYDRFADALAALDEADWSRPTDCPGWDVRQLACHTIGMAAMGSGLAGDDPAAGQGDAASAGGPRGRADRTDRGAGRRARPTGRPSASSPRRAWIGPRAVRGRRRTPGFVRRRTLPQVQHVGGVAERWTIGFLDDVILTRDVWMHRMDVARATGREPVLTRDHDGAIVGDVVAEWAARHGAAYHLTLTGPLGGTWSPRSGGEVIELDAVDFCRILSGRGEARRA